MIPSGTFAVLSIVSLPDSLDDWNYNRSQNDAKTTRILAHCALQSFANMYIPEHRYQLFPAHDFERTVYILSRPWPVFRARHGSRIVCMSVTLKVTLKFGTMFRHNVPTGESIWHNVPAFADGPRLISLVWRKQVETLIPAVARETQGMGSKLWLD